MAVTVAPVSHSANGKHKAQSTTIAGSVVVKFAVVVVAVAVAVAVVSLGAGVSAVQLIAVLLYIWKFLGGCRPTHIPA